MGTDDAAPFQFIAFLQDFVQDFLLVFIRYRVEEEIVQYEQVQPDQVIHALLVFPEVGFFQRSKVFQKFLTPVILDMIVYNAPNG